MNDDADQIDTGTRRSNNETATTRSTSRKRDVKYEQKKAQAASKDARVDNFATADS